MPLYRKIIIIFAIFTLILLFLKAISYISLQLALRNGKIIFINNSKATKFIYSQNLNGSGLLCLTDEGGAYALPSWSPDGKKVIYLHGKNISPINFQLYVMDSDGKNKKQLTVAPEKVWSISWSKEGENILYASKVKEFFNIFLIEPDGNNKKQLTSSNMHSAHPCWSPDNKFIVFDAFYVEGNDGDIYMMDCDGSNVKKLTSSHFKDLNPDWSPDGEKILFIRQTAKYEKEIFTMNADGTDIKDVTKNEAIDMSPSWSPDGKRIAFTSDRDGNMEIYIMDRDGQNVRRITENPQISDWGAIWHKNGQRLIFISDYDYELYGTAIYMTDLKGSDPVKITDLDGRESQQDLFQK